MIARRMGWPLVASVSLFMVSSVSPLSYLFQSATRNLRGERRILDLYRFYPWDTVPHFPSRNARKESKGDVSNRTSDALDHRSDRPPPPWLVAGAALLCRSGDILPRYGTGLPPQLALHRPCEPDTATWRLLPLRIRSGFVDRYSG